MYAYRRALVLINPVRQLGILLHSTQNELRVWDRRVRRLRPLLEAEEPSAETTSSSSDATHDLARATFFHFNQHWTSGVNRSLRHAMSFARRYAEYGDYEVSGAALAAIVSINATYIESKGKTFYANNPFIENPLSRDSVITETLEHLRQNVQIGLVRRDEQQIEQTLQTMAALVRLYLDIDYSSPYAEKSHAQLAAGYITSAVKTVVPHSMADVLLEGQRLIGRCAQSFIEHSKPNDSIALSEEISLISCAGCAKDDYRAVTMEGMAQLANMTASLLRSRNDNIVFAAERIRKDVALIVRLFLTLPDTSVTGIHSRYLGPYYSSTSMTSLRARLTELANAISNAVAEDADARQVVRNIAQWADRMYQTEKELLLVAISVKSQFTFDMIHWITGITEILLAISNAAACDSHSREKIRDEARWLIATLTWIPDDKETVTFVENFQLTEKLFEAVLDARNRGCEDIANEFANILLSWAFKGGRYFTGWNILERGLSASAAIALAGQAADIDALKGEVASVVRGKRAPERDVLEQAAREMRDRAFSLRRRGHSLSTIEQYISETDYKMLAPLLKDLADLMSPQS